jgi:hypothetical protein
MARPSFFQPTAATAAGTAVATVSLLHDLQPIATGLRAALERLGIAGAPTIDQRLQREGRVAVFEGSPEQARGLELALRALGLSTSLNLRHAEVRPLRRPWR